MLQLFCPPTPCHGSGRDGKNTEQQSFLVSLSVTGCSAGDLARGVRFFTLLARADLCHVRWDKKVEMWKQPGEYLGNDLASQKTSDRHKALVFWLDELMDDHHLHTCWAHVLDGFFLLDQLTDDFQAYMFKFCGPCR